MAGRCATSAEVDHQTAKKIGAKELPMLPNTPLMPRVIPCLRAVDTRQAIPDSPSTRITFG
jgi:hypothetical protein